MSRTFRREERRIRVRAIRRERPDLAKLGRALLELAQLQAEAEAEQVHCQQLSDEEPKRAHRQRKAAGGTG